MMHARANPGYFPKFQRHGRSRLSIRVSSSRKALCLKWFDRSETTSRVSLVDCPDCLVRLDEFLEQEKFAVNVVGLLYKKQKPNRFNTGRIKWLETRTKDE